MYGKIFISSLASDQDISKQVGLLQVHRNLYVSQGLIVFLFACFASSSAVIRVYLDWIGFPTNTSIYVCVFGGKDK